MTPTRRHRTLGVAAMAFAIAFLVGVLVSCARPDPVEIARLACADYGLAPMIPGGPPAARPKLPAIAPSVRNALIMSHPTVTVRPAP